MRDFEVEKEKNQIVKNQKEMNEIVKVEKEKNEVKVEKVNE